MDKTKLTLAAMGAFTLLVTGTGVTYAASGGSFVLGHGNRESSTSVLKNSGSGAALSLKTKSARTPPLAVSNSTKIARLDADLLDGLSSAAFQRRISGTCPAGLAVRSVGSGGDISCSSPFARVVVVHPGATPVAGGDALRSVVSGLTGSASSPTLVLVEPGVFDLGGNSLVMKDNVSVVGFGPGITTVQAETSTNTLFNGVVGAGAVLAGMTIDVTSTTPASAIVNAIELPGGSLTLRNLSVSVQGLDAAAGIRLDGGALAARDVDVTSPDVGLSDDGVTAVFWGGQLNAVAAAVAGVNNPTIRIASSELVGGVSGANFLCADDFDGGYATLNSTCG